MGCVGKFQQTYSICGPDQRAFGKTMMKGPGGYPQIRKKDTGDRIVITRPAVSVDILGFYPDDLKEKKLPGRPILELLEYYKPKQVRFLIKIKLLISPLAYIGMEHLKTWDHCR